MKLRNFNRIEIDVPHSSGTIAAYYNTNDIFEVIDVNARGYCVVLPEPLSNGVCRVRLAWDDLEDDFFSVPNRIDVSQRRNHVDDEFLQPGATVCATEEVRFWNGPAGTWSPYYFEGFMFKVLRRDDATDEIILEPEAGDLHIQLHLTNWRFFKEVQEKSPEDLPTNDGVGKAEGMLPSNVQELQALIQEQAQLLEHGEQKYSQLLTMHETSLKNGEEKYSELFTIHQTSLKRRIAQATGAGESLPSSIVDDLLATFMCPFLNAPPEASDTVFLENGQLVSQSRWDAYLSRLPPDTTPICPLTRDKITQRQPISCPTLRYMSEALQRMCKEQQESSLPVDVDGAPSDGKRRKV